ncbi:MAG: UDP-N-acetylmuramoyl-tripeptide--D-alanyl-D-alanine ligase [Bacteroidetes bacterium]|nr:MAG: UDP-N-acetylmuramoyl-tripeptide--D-alanyl-D-alanine ligase [Bacteroidota bacterium]
MLVESSVAFLLDHFRKHPSVSTDTRSIAPGDIFFALRGDRFDGNVYAAKALEQGASLAVVDDPGVVAAGDVRYLLVPDALRCLQQFATARRRQWTFPVLGITGSNGKTTTKELIASVLGTERRVFATRGNYNNHIGVPLTLLAVPDDTEIAIVEMGANQPGDIAELAAIAEPTHGLITNVGYAHIERLGSLEGVRQTKGALFDFVRAAGGHLFVNAADARVLRTAGEYPHQTRFGRPEDDFWFELNAHRLDGLQLTVHAQAWTQAEVFHSQLTGDYNAQNILSAIAVGVHMGISLEGIRRGIFQYVSDNNRSQLVQRGRYTIWLDAYNANPSSMRASIRHIFRLGRERVALILGDMLELGEDGPTHHHDMGTYINGLGPEVVIGIGPLMKHLVDAIEGPAYWAPDVETAAQNIGDWLGEADTLLLKGSRGMALERLLDHLPTT